MANMRFALRSSVRSNLPLVSLIAMIVLLWVTGGASRADTMGQVFVRAGSWLIAAIAILFGPRPVSAGVRPVLLLLLATITLPLLQLVPLPPAWWQAMPGRDILLVPGEPAGWRPWTMTPGATRNALASLVVPAVMLLLLMQADGRTKLQLPGIVLTMIAGAVVLGLLQFSGVGFNNPFLNDTPGEISGIFANRNHFALCIAIGCLITPVWAFQDNAALGWRGPVAVALLLLFVLTILATGSRSGLLVCALALVLAPLLVIRQLRGRLRHLPVWVLPVLAIALFITLAGFVWLSFIAERAVAIDRLLNIEAGSDLRRRALPTVVTMIQAYMPLGSGLGGFDPVFRIHEPYALLKATYFNQAHNDFLGVALDAGVLGILLMVVAITWWLTATIRVWRAFSDANVAIARLGSAMLFLVLIASLTDYAARTPTMMAMIVLAACWLSLGAQPRSETALPGGARDL